MIILVKEVGQMHAYWKNKHHLFLIGNRPATPTPFVREEIFSYRCKFDFSYLVCIL